MISSRLHQLKKVLQNKFHHFKIYCIPSFSFFTLTHSFCGCFKYISYILLCFSRAFQTIIAILLAQIAILETYQVLVSFLRIVFFVMSQVFLVNNRNDWNISPEMPNFWSPFYGMFTKFSGLSRETHMRITSLLLGKKREVIPCPNLLVPCIS